MIDGLATEDERAVAMALIGEMTIEAYRGMLVARQGAGVAGKSPIPRRFSPSWVPMIAMTRLNFLLWLYFNVLISPYIFSKRGP